MSSPTADEIDVWERVSKQVGSLEAAKGKTIDELFESLKKATISAEDIDNQILRVDALIKQDSARARRLLQLDEGLLGHLKGREKAILDFFDKYAEQIKAMLQNKYDLLLGSSK